MQNKKVQEPIFDTGSELRQRMRSSTQVGYTRTFAMQPIIDREKSLFAFEALYRAGLSDRFTGDPHLATRIMSLNWSDFGLQAIAGDAKIFFNCTQRSIEEGYLTGLPTSIVLEILEDLVPTDELLQSCIDLQAMGFELSLDDFQYSPEMEGLMAIADYIKVDFRLLDRKQRRDLLDRLRPCEAKLIAEKIETREEYEEAYDQGFDLFQGHVIGRPVLFSRRSFIPEL
jgi:EAL and modified HD-GYP domain-containing signal transduction protein